MGLIVGVFSVGYINEPSCIPRHLNEHLAEMCADLTHAVAPVALERCAGEAIPNAG
jgi:hypothetical protein